jgi:hypothetical protein
MAYQLTRDCQSGRYTEMNACQGGENNSSVNIEEYSKTFKS